MNKFIFFRLFIIYMVFILFTISGFSQRADVKMPNQQAGFWENKGQYSDQDGNKRTDLLYVYHGEGYKLQLNKNRFSYDLYQRVTDTLGVSEATGEMEIEQKYIFHRVDVELLGANKNAMIIQEGKSKSFKNFYLEHTGKKGATGVHNYKKITYKNIYPNIDIVFYLKNKQLKYDFVVREGGNVADIKLKVNGADDYEADSDFLKLETSLGTLFNEFENTDIKAELSNGIIQFKTLKVLNNKTKKISASVKLNSQHKKILSKKLPAPKNSKDSLPANFTFYQDRAIGTYYGDSIEDRIYGVDVDSDRNIFVVGTTNSDENIATDYVFQGIYNGNTDGIIAKTDTDMQTLIWSTYYGGNEFDLLFDISINMYNYIAVVGYTNSSNMAHNGFQSSFGGSNDGIFAKFNSNGERICSSYLGGSSNDEITGVTADDDDFYIIGRTTSENNISTTGSYQPEYGGARDIFLAKIKQTGTNIVKDWCTYIGDNNPNWSGSISSYRNYSGAIITKGDYVYIAGGTGGAISDDFPGYKNNDDIVLAKFDKSGNFQTGKCFGANLDDEATCIGIDSNNNIWVGGYTNSKEDYGNITTDNAHQREHGAGENNDGFIMKFSQSGDEIVKEYGSYLGGEIDDYIYSLAIDDYDYVVFVGESTSEDNISISGSYQTELADGGGGGELDAIFAKFNPAGICIWSTYYGLAPVDYGNDIVVDNQGYIIGVGATRTVSQMTTPDVFKPNYIASDEGYIVRFCDLIITTEAHSQTVWTGNTATISVTAIGSYPELFTYQWYKDDEELVDNDTITGSSDRILIINPVVSTHEGVYTCIVTNNCGEVSSEATLTVKEIEINPAEICLNESATITASPGGTMYEWSVETTPNNWSEIQSGVGLDEITVTPDVAGTYNYRLIVYGFNEPYDSAYVSLIVNPLPVATATAEPIIICDTEELTLSGSATGGTPDYNFFWSSNPVGFTSEEQNTTDTPDGNTVYNLLVIDEKGCQATDNVSITVNPLPYPHTLMGGGGYCDGVDGVEIFFNPSESGVSYQLIYNGTDYGDPIEGDALSGRISFGTELYPAGIYTVRASSNSTPCTRDISNSVEVEVYPLPDVDAGPDTIICENPDVLEQIFAQTLGGIFSGSDYIGGYTDNWTFNPAVAGTYELTYTYIEPVHLCENTDVKIVQVIPLTTVTVPETYEVCVDDDPVTLQPGIPTTGTWSVEDGIFYPPSIAGDYTLRYFTGIEGTSCYNYDEMIVTVHPKPHPHILRGGGGYCDGVDGVEIFFNTSESGVSYQLIHNDINYGDPIEGDASDGRISFGTELYPAGIYTVRASSNSTPCTRDISNSVEVEVYPLPDVDAGPDTIICENPDVLEQIFAQTLGGSFSGSDYIDGNIDNWTFNPAVTGTYELTYTYIEPVHLCENTDVKIVQVITLEPVTVPETYEVCVEGDSIILPMGIPTTGIWSVEDGIFYPPSIAGDYTLRYFTGIQGTSCYNYDEMIVTVHPKPDVYGGDTEYVCANIDPFYLSGHTPAGGTFTDNENNTISLDSLFNPASAEIGNNFLTYTYTDGNGCTNFATKIVHVYPIPIIETEDTTLCNQPIGIQLTVTVTTDNPGNGIFNMEDYDYVTEDGIFTPSGLPGGTGIYDVIYTYTDGNECIHSEVLKVTVEDAKILTIPEDFSLCLNAPDTTLQATPEGGYWTGDIVTQAGTVTTNPAGTFSLIYIYAAGTSCELRDTVEVTIHGLPVVNAGDDIEICYGDQNFIQDPPAQPANGIWTGLGIIDEVTGLFNTVYSGTPYILTVDTITYSYTDSNSCTNSDTKIITINPLPEIILNKDTLNLCLNPEGSYQLDSLLDSEEGGIWTYEDGIVIQNGIFIPNTEGDFNVIYTYTNTITGCENSETIVITVTDYDDLTMPADIEICHCDELATLFTNISGGTWECINFPDLIDTLGNVNTCYTPSSTPYILTYTVGEGTCEQIGNMSIKIYALPFVEAYPQTICEDVPELTLTANQFPGSWDIILGSGTINDNIFYTEVAGNTDVEFTYTDPNTTCVNKDTTTITVNPLPTIILNRDTLPLCLNPDGSYQLDSLLDSEEGGIWTYENETLIQNGIFIPDTEGDFNVIYTYTNTITGCENRDTTVITVTDYEDLIMPNDTSVCLNSSIFLLEINIPGGTWTCTNEQDAIDETGNFDPTGLLAGEYYLNYTVGEGTCMQTGNMTVTILPLPEVTAHPQTICEDVPEIILTADQFPGIWVIISGTGTINDNIFYTNGDGIIEVEFTYTDNNGCINSDTTIITVNPLPEIILNKDTLPLCFNPSSSYQLNSLLDSEEGGIWTYENGTVIQNGIFIPNTEGDFNVIYTYTNTITGCENRDTTVITVTDYEDLIMPNDTSVCLNSSIFLLEINIPGGTWTCTNEPDAIDETGNFDPTGLLAGEYYLNYTVGEGTCMQTGNMTVTILPLPEVTAYQQTICEDVPELILTADQFPGIWEIISGSGTINDNIFYTNGDGIIEVEFTYTDNNGCINSDTTTITVNPLPEIILNKDTLPLCFNPSSSYQLDSLLDSEEGGIWTYENGTLIQNGIFIPDTEGDFNVIYTYTNTITGCENRDTTVITVTDYEDLIMPNDTSVCLNSSIFLLEINIPGGTWTCTNEPDAIDETGNFDPTGLLDGEYYLNYTVGEGTCMQTGNMTVTILPLPEVTAHPQTICEDVPEIILTADQFPGIWVIISGSGTITDNTFYTEGDGIIEVEFTYTDNNGCINSDTTTITVNPLPVVYAGEDTTLCNQAIGHQLIGTGLPAGGTYIWYGNNFITTTGMFTPNGTGTFECIYEYTDPSGCVNTDTMYIEVVGVVSADAGVDREVCIDWGSIQMVGLPVDGYWTPQSIISSSGLLTITEIGTFTVTYNYGIGTCFTQDNVDITVHPLPIVSAGNDVTVCGDAPAFNLSGTPSGGFWMGPGITNAQSGTFDPSVSGTGVFTITYTYEDPLTNCINTAEVTVSVIPLPSVNFTNTHTCDGENTYFNDLTNDLGFEITTWFWDFGDGVTSADANPVHLFTNYGIYNVSLTVTNIHGCSNTIVKPITVGPVPEANFEADTVCAECATQFTDISIAVGGVAITAWEWDYGDGSPLSMFQNPVHAFSEAGLHNVRLVVTNEAGCSDTIYKDVLVYPNPTSNFSTDSVCFLQPTTFTDLSNGEGYEIIVWKWIYGDGTDEIYTESTNPQHIYPEAGTYLSSLITVNEFGCADSVYIEVVVHPLPEVEFLYDSIVCLNTEVTFTNITVGACSPCEEPFMWIIEGDTIFTGFEPINWTFTEPGFHTVTLIAETIYGCIDSISHTIHVIEAPVPGFDMIPDSGCVPLTVGFINNTIAFYETYVWDFGNGTSSTLHTPLNVIYDDEIIQNTEYIVYMQATNICGSASLQDTVTVYPQPIAIISSSLSEGCSPLTVTIFNSSNTVEYDVCDPDDPASYAWYLEDELISTEEQIGDLTLTHNSPNDSTFNLKLIVNSCCGSDTAYFEILVHPHDVNSFFNITENTVCPLTDVNFNNTSTGAENFSWIINNDFVFSTEENPTYIFDNLTDSVIIYNVCLIAVSDCSSDTFCLYISVYPKPELDIDVPESVCEEDTVFVYNQSPDLAACYWQFDNGETSNDCDTYTIFNVLGSHEIIFVGTGAEHGCTDTIKSLINVLERPHASFSVSDTCECVSEIFYFEADSINPNTSEIYLWDFGDGITGNGQNIEHSFAEHGTYLVTLTVTNCNGCEDSFSMLVCTYELSTADFDISIGDYSCISPAQVTLTNLSQNAHSFFWDFGNGQSSIEEQPPVITYNATGDYTITLIVVSEDNCLDTLQKTITIYNGAEVVLETENTTGCSPYEVSFTGNEESSSRTYLWDFGDGAFSNEANPTHTFVNEGQNDTTFLIEITMTYNNGLCKDTKNNNITVHHKPIADFDFSYDLSNKNDTNKVSHCLESGHFENLSKYATNYTWYIINEDLLYTNEEVSNDSLPDSFYYKNSGNYLVTLIAGTQYACTDSITKEMSIANPTLFIPNAFVPCCSGCKNEDKYFIPKGIGLDEYHIQVFDKWGALLWESKELDENGSPTGKWQVECGFELPAGTYYWSVSGITKSCCKFNAIGEITLIR